VQPAVEVAIHTILYVRQIYPADLFVRRKKYDTPVFQSRHPGLNEYISGAVKAIGEELALASCFFSFSRINDVIRTRRGPVLSQGNVAKVVVVIKDKDQVALERFIFSVENMVQIEAFDNDTRFVLRCDLFVTGENLFLLGCRSSIQGAMSDVSLGQYFRSFLIKLNMIEAQLGQMYLGGELDAYR
jgi:mitotic spindle assembly checkpoint protein MAD2B